jgi:hypothetical protein
MAAPLCTCTKEEQRSVIRFLISEGVKPTEVHRRMKVQYWAMHPALALSWRRVSSSFHPWLWSLNLPLPHTWRDSVTWVTLFPPPRPLRPRSEGTVYTVVSQFWLWIHRVPFALSLVSSSNSIWLGEPKIGFGRILGRGCGGSPAVACHWGLVYGGDSVG